MITIAKNANFINAVINNPQVHLTACPGREGETEDLSDLIASEDSFVLERYPFGGFILTPNDYDSYIVHTVFLPNTPTSVVTESVKQAMWVAFVELEVTKIYSYACSSNIPATKLMRRTGFSSLFSRPSRTKEGFVETFGCIDIQDYILKSPELSQLGERFHEQVEDSTNHEDDHSHDCFVGAAYAMLASGQIEKAVRVYNTWALLAGYCPIEYKEGDDEVKVGYMTIKLTESLDDIREVLCPTER